MVLTEGGGRQYRVSLSLRGSSLFGSMFNGFGGNKIDDVGMSFIRDMGGRFIPSNVASYLA